MASSMQFDLVSPEAALASMTVSSVEIPGSEGDFTAMPDHAPVITCLLYTSPSPRDRQKSRMPSSA